MKNRLIAFGMALRDSLVGDRTKKQKQRVEEAAWKAARLRSDIGFHDEMDQFYRGAMDAVDPHNSPDDAWAFAAASQQQHDNLRDRKIVQVKYAKAEARRHAEFNRLAALQSPKSK